MLETYQIDCPRKTIHLPVTYGDIEFFLDEINQLSLSNKKIRIMLEKNQRIIESRGNMEFHQSLIDNVILKEPPTASTKLNHAALEAPIIILEELGLSEKECRPTIKTFKETTEKVKVTSLIQGVLQKLKSFCH